MVCRINGDSVQCMAYDIHYMNKQYLYRHLDMVCSLTLNVVYLDGVQYMSYIHRYIYICHSL